jgi:hypothetical protein
LKITERIVVSVHSVTPGIFQWHIFNKGWIDGVDKAWAPGKKSAEATVWADQVGGKSRMT